MIPQGTSLQELSENYKHLSHYPILGALVNNKITGLDYRIYNPKTISFFDITDKHGYRMYINSVAFLLYKAVRELFPSAKLCVEHSLLEGLYCRVFNSGLDNEILACKLREYMKALVEKDIPFTSKNMLMEDALKLMADNDNDETCRLLEAGNKQYASISFLFAPYLRFNARIASKRCSVCSASFSS